MYPLKPESTKWWAPFLRALGRNWWAVSDEKPSAWIVILSAYCQWPCRLLLRPWKCSACQLIVEEESGWALRKCGGRKVQTDWPVAAAATQHALGCWFYRHMLGSLLCQAWTVSWLQPWIRRGPCPQGTYSLVRQKKKLPLSITNVFIDYLLYISKILLSPHNKMATHSSILAWRIPWTRSLAGYSLWGHKELDTTEWLILSQ